MAFGAERRRLKGIMTPVEEIVASDLRYGIKEWSNLSRPPALVVWDRAIYVLTSVREKSVLGIPFNILAGVGRRSTMLQSEIHLITRESDGSLVTVTCVFHPRGRRQRTGDLITEHFFGRVTKDTEIDPPKS
jgi:hypothetical protein